MPNVGTYGLDIHGGGVATAQNEGVPGFSGPDMSFGGDMQEFMKKALMEQYAFKKQQQEQARIDAIRAEQAMQPREGIHAPARMAMGHASLGNAGSNGLGGMERDLRVQQMGNAAEQMSLDRLPAPTKLYGGNPGTVAGMVMDPSAMNAASRRSFLPRESSEIQDTPEQTKRRASSEGLIGAAGSTHPTGGY